MESQKGYFFFSIEEKHKICELTRNHLVQTLYFREEEEKKERLNKAQNVSAGQ